MCAITVVYTSYFLCYSQVSRIRLLAPLQHLVETFCPKSFRVAVTAYV
ncbi:MAG: hypothetical protein RLZZ230_969 [Candidatus Parcubacteria bacterium]|jgi:hypothetical protein